MVKLVERATKKMYRSDDVSVDSKFHFKFLSAILLLVSQSFAIPRNKLYN